MTDQPELESVYVDSHGDFVNEHGEPIRDRLSLGRILIGFGVTIALVIVIPLLVGFAAYRDVTGNQLRENRAFAVRLANERSARQKALRQFVFEQCVQSEIRDVVFVQQLRAARDRARATLPPDSPELLHTEQIIQDGINALEPENEKDCTP